MWILGPVKQGDLLTEESGEPGLRQARGIHKAQIGDRRNVHITGSTHRPSGIRDVNSKPVHEELVLRLVDNRDAA